MKKSLRKLPLIIQYRKKTSLDIGRSVVQWIHVSRGATNLSDSRITPTSHNSDSSLFRQPISSFFEKKMTTQFFNTAQRPTKVLNVFVVRVTWFVFILDINNDIDRMFQCTILFFKRLKCFLHFLSDLCWVVGVMVKTRFQLSDIKSVVLQSQRPTHNAICGDMSPSQEVTHAAQETLVHNSPIAGKILKFPRHGGVIYGFWSLQCYIQR